MIKGQEPRGIDGQLAELDQFTVEVLANYCGIMHEWLFEFKRAELEAKYSKTFDTKGQFWGHIEALVPSSKFMRDLANASKHVRLTLKPSTSMTHIANTVIQMTGWSDGGYGTGGYGGQTMVMKDQGSDVSVDDCIRDLMKFWSARVTELYP